MVAQVLSRRSTLDSVVTLQSQIVHHIVFVTSEGYELFGVVFANLTAMVSYLYETNPRVRWDVPLQTPIPRDAAEGMPAYA